MCALNPTHSMKKTRLFSILCWLLLVGMSSVAPGAPVDRDHAVLAAARWHAQTPRAMGKPMGEIGTAKTYFNTKREARFHVVDLKPSGFVVIAADDELEPVLAFAEAGKFIGQAGNPLYDLLLRDTEHRVTKSLAEMATGRTSTRERLKIKSKWALLTGAAPAAGPAPTSGPAPSNTTAVDDECVAPMVQTEWSQSTTDSTNVAVYNYYTPPYGAGNPNNFVCGCVATAMAQIMRYWEWPQTGVGTGSYSVTVDGTSEQETLRGGDGAGGPYDWADMVLVPGSNVTTVQCQAIGALTADAGVSVNMDYDEGGVDESGAFLSSAIMRNTFHYANAASVSGTAGIITAIRTNLDAGEPVSFAIYGPDGGHQVVGDGYGYNQGTLYVHLNVGWGPYWAGLDNIWYNLPEIDPPDSGYTFNSIGYFYFNINPKLTGEIISGRITNASGTPVGGIKVNLTGAATATGTTNQEGIYFFNGVPSNSTFTVKPAGSGYTYSPVQSVVSTGFSGDFGSVGDVTADFGAIATGTGPFTVTPSAGANGSVSPNTVQTVTSGSSVTFTSTPSAGYTVNQWLLNGQVAQVGSTNYTLNDVTGDDTVQVTFSPLPTPGYMISPAPATTFSSSTVTFQWNPGAGNTEYMLELGSTMGGSDLFSSGDIPAGTVSETVNGIPTDGRKIYATLYSLTSSGWTDTGSTYTAATITQTFTVTPSAGSNGVISPTTAQTVSSGGSVIFTAQPNAGYEVSQWLVNGSAVGTSGTSYTVSNVEANTTVEVTFGPVTAAAQMVSPVAGSTLPGASVNFQWAAGTGSSGYYLYVGTSPGFADIFNSGSIGASTLSQTATGIPTNGSPIWVRLWTASNGSWLYNDYEYTAANLCTVTPSAGANGSINPSQPVIVTVGSSVLFTATPSAGYVVNQWLENGDVTQTSGTACTLIAATGTTTLEVTFAPGANAPVISEGGPAQVTETTAILSGVVNPVGVSTTAMFQFGSTTGYGWNTTGVNIGSGTSSVLIGGTAIGLTPGTTYHYQIVTTSTAGTFYGPDETFTARPANAMSQILAVSGEVVTGIPSIPAGAVWRGFGPPAIDNNGNVAFLGSWRDGRLLGGPGIFVNQSLLAATGGSVPGLAGVSYRFLTNPVLDSGNIAFTAALGGKGVNASNATGIFSDAGGNGVALVARTGSVAPGAGGALFASFSSVAVSGSSVAFIGQLEDAKGVATINRTNAVGLWVDDPVHGLNLVLREGEVIHGQTIGTLTAFLPGNGSPGQGRGWLQTPTGTAQIIALVTFTDKAQALLGVDALGNVTTLSHSGIDGAAGAPQMPGTMFQTYGVPAADLAGDSAFLAILKSGAGGVVAADAPGIFENNANTGMYDALVRVTGTAAGGGTFAQLKDVVLAPDGSGLAFPAIIKGAGIVGADATTVWWLPSGGPLTLLAQGGTPTLPVQQPPDVNTGAEWGAFNSLAINGGLGNGPVFSATLVAGKGRVPAGATAGVWGVSSTGSLRGFFRAGTAVDGKVIRSFTFLAAVPGSAAVPRWMNDSGEMIWLATFTDGTQGIVETQAP